MLSNHSDFMQFFCGEADGSFGRSRLLEGMVALWLSYEEGCCGVGVEWGFVGV